MPLKDPIQAPGARPRPVRRQAESRREPIVVRAGRRLGLVYAVGAFRDIPYFMVLTTGANCADVVAHLNPSPHHANSRGFLSWTVGTVPVGTAPGADQVCFPAGDGSTAAAPVNLTVTA